MDLRVLCVFVAVAYVDVSARITCNFQTKNWTSAMQHCLNQSGTPVSSSTVWSVAGLHLNGSFWTADYVSRIQTTDSPVECEYRTLTTGNQFSQSKLGYCKEIRHYICCDHNMKKPCVKNGTWQEASKCSETYSTPQEQLPVGDYWLWTAFGYQNYVFTGGRLQNLDRCGMLDVNGNFQFVSDCETSQYSFCEVENYTGSDLSDCGSMNETTSTESIVRNHASSSSGSALGIGLGVSLSIVVIVIITTVGVCVYKRRYRRKKNNSQVSVRMNALYDVSGQNETPRKPGHTHESYVYAVPSLLRKNDGNRHGEDGNGNEFAELKVYSKATTTTQRKSNKADVQAKIENNTVVAGDTTVIQSDDERGLRHVYGNTGVMYDGVDFPDAPDSISINVYSHLGNHDNEDVYNVASCTPTQQTQSRMSDYDRLDKHS